LGFPSPAHTVTKKKHERREEKLREREEQEENQTCVRRKKERDRERDFTAGCLHGLDRHLILHGIIIRCFLELGLPDCLDLQEFGTVQQIAATAERRRRRSSSSRREEGSRRRRRSVPKVCAMRSGATWRAGRQ
jgi:hypothetical protein